MGWRKRPACRWARLTNKRHKKQLARRSKKRAAAERRRGENAILVNAPRKVSLQDAKTHADLTSFLAAMRSKLATGSRKIVLNFWRTNGIVAGGGLLLFAELQRSMDLYPEVKFLCHPSKDNRTNQVLQHLGIFQMLGCSYRVRLTRQDVVTWRSARGEVIDCEPAGIMIEQYSSLKPRSQLLFRAASEAISNAINHAYDGTREDNLRGQSNKNWWMFCREYENKFAMSVCDLGVGIPNTLTNKNPGEIVRDILSKLSGGLVPNDSNMIMGAMEYARTRTENDHQGKGLMDLQKIIESSYGARMHLFSNRGCVTYDSDNGYQQFNYRNSILGTLVVWQLPIDDGTDTNEYLDDQPSPAIL